MAESNNKFVLENNLIRFMPSTIHAYSSTKAKKYCKQNRRKFKPIKTKSAITKLNGSDKSFTFRWEKIRNANGYQIQYSINKKMKNAIKVDAKNKSKLKVKNLKKNKRYYVRVRSYRIKNGKKKYSKWSAKRTVTTK